MCGIVSVRTTNESYPNGERVKTLFEAQRGRGTNGFGFLEIFPKRISLHRFVNEEDAMKVLEKSEAKDILFHHRIPTSTDNNVKTNHPIVANSDVYKHNYYFVHNGVISNDDELKGEHEKLGIEYSTVDGNKFNDSEALMHELILIIEGMKLPEQFSVKGSLAFVMIQTDKFNNPLKKFYGRNEFNPLSIDELADVVVLRSEGKNQIEPNKLFEYDYETKLTTVSDMKMDGTEPKTVEEFNQMLHKMYEGDRLMYGDTSGLRKNEAIILITSARSSLRKMQLANENSVLSGKTGWFTTEISNLEHNIDSLKTKFKYL